MIRFALPTALLTATLCFAAACDKEDDKLAATCIDEALREAGKDKACTMEYNPVCGCDGVTYGNACAAEVAGVTKTTPGECGS